MLLQETLCVFFCLQERIQPKTRVLTSRALQVRANQLDLPPNREASGVADPGTSVVDHRPIRSRLRLLLPLAQNAAVADTHTCSSLLSQACIRLTQLLTYCFRGEASKRRYFKHATYIPVICGIDLHYQLVCATFEFLYGTPIGLSMRKLHHGGHAQ
jgi:hypothetical protein